MTPQLQKACLIIFGLALSLLIAEVFIRSFSEQIAGRHDIADSSFIVDWETIHLPAFNPRIGFETAPNLDVIFNGARLRTNRFGRRGPETSLARRENWIRIVGLGDSVMMGWGIEDDALYLARRHGPWRHCTRTV